MTTVTKPNDALICPVIINRAAAAAQPRYMNSTTDVVSRIRNSNSDAIEREKLSINTAVSKLLDKICAYTGAPYLPRIAIHLGNNPSRAIAAGSSACIMIQPFSAPSALIAPNAAIAVPASAPPNRSTKSANGAADVAVTAAGSISTTAEQTIM